MIFSFLAFCEKIQIFSFINALIIKPVENECFAGGPGTRRYAGDGIKGSDSGGNAGGI